MGIQNQNLIISAVVVLVVAYLFNFLQINFNPELGSVYQGMSFLYLGVILLAFLIPGSDDGYPIFKGKVNWGSAFLWGAGAYIVFYLAVSFVIPQFFSVGTMSTMDLIRNFAQAGFQFQATAFEQSNILTHFSFDALIPVIETFALFAGTLYLWHLISNINIYDSNLSTKLIITVVFITAIFTVYHATSKGITNSRDLAISAIFAMITASLIINRQQIIDSIIMHSINNTASTLRLS